MKSDQTTSQDTLDEAGLARLAQNALDASVDSLDAATLSKLNQARQRAVETQQRSRLIQNWLPVGAMAFALLVLVAVVPGLRPGPTPGVETTVEEAYYGSSEDLELVEDLDMVLWLLDAEDHAS